MLYFVKVDGQFGYVDRTGKIVVSPQFRQVSSYGREAFAGLQTNGELFILDASGATIAKVRHIDGFHGGFSDGLLCVKSAEKYGFIDAYGKILIDFKFFSPSQFVLGKAIVQDSGRFGVIDTTGSWVLEPSFEYIVDIHERSTSFCVRVSEEQYKVIDFSGQEATDRVFGALHSECENVVPFRRVGEVAWGWLDLVTHEEVEPKYTEVGLCSQATIPFQLNGKWGIAKTDGAIKLPACYDFLGPISSERRRFCTGASKYGALRGGKYGYLNGDSQVAIPAQFDRANDFNNDAARVSVGSRPRIKSGWIDEAGRYFWAPSA